MRSGFYGYGFNVGATSAASMGAQPLGRVRARRRHQRRLPAVGRRGDRRAHQRHSVRCARIADRPIRRPSSSSARCARTGPNSTATSSRRWSRPTGSLIRTEARRPILRRVRRWPPYVGTYNTTTGAGTRHERDGKLQLAIGTTLECPWIIGTATSSPMSGLRNSPPGTIFQGDFDGNKLTLEFYDTSKRGRSRNDDHRRHGPD